MIQSPENNFFTAADIERYHKGEMSAEERHALEKAALDDPFLADALEGYAYTTHATEDLEKIKARLQPKTVQKKTIVLWKTWMKVAAVLLVVGAGVWLMFRTSSEN